MHKTETLTAGDIRVFRTTETLSMDEAACAVAECAAELDDRRGVVLGSNYDYPGRYSRHDIAFVDPPVALTSQGRCFRLEALNKRGEILLAILAPVVDAVPAVFDTHRRADLIFGRLRAAHAPEDEALRTRRPSTIDVVRAIRDAFGSDSDRHLGLYGALRTIWADSSNPSSGGSTVIPARAMWSSTSPTRWS